MALTNAWLEMNFGDSYSGLATVGYRLYGSGDTDIVVRTTSGVNEIGTNTGNYGVVVPTVADTVVGIEWDTGDSILIYKTENLAAYNQIAFN